MNAEAFYAKATLLPNKLGCFVYPAIHEFLKPEVMTARTMQHFNAQEGLREGIHLSLQARRLEMTDVTLTEGEDAEGKLVFVSGKIDGEDFKSSFRRVIVIEGEV